MLREPQPIEVEGSPFRKPDHGSLPSCLRACSFNTTGPRSKDEPHASLGETQAWGFRGCSAKWGECGDAATTIDMHPLQQRIGSLSLLTE